MSYRISKSENYLLLEFKGKTSLEENVIVRQETISELNENGIDAMLVDMTEADLSEVKLEELHGFGESWVDVLFASSTKFAVLVPYQNPSRAKIDLSVSIGIMEGVQLKIFEERALAIDWLNM